MAQMLAPYNNSMRLGQGFNSYTQQICLDQAVLPDTQQNRTRLAQSITVARKKVKAGGAQGNGTIDPSETQNGVKTIDSSHGKAVEIAQENTEEAPEDPLANIPMISDDVAKKQTEEEDEAIEVPPWVKPQIVTYSSRFVDKLSDVTDAMNISGSLSIKTATIGGKASGSYVDSDKFKSSDVNFHLQVKVTNQVHDALNYNIFNKISTVSGKQFPEVYGDSFISGWEEGGELNAIISIKVLDKSKIFQVKASIEAELTTPSIAGKVKAKVDLDKTTLSKETETTVAVNWSGGGSIKNPQDDWSIEALKKAAAAFPDLVAITPQRTYAILTRYTALESFHRQQTNFKPLDYENAGIYTGALLDAYMDYKAMWKQISYSTYELEANRATIDMGEPSEDIASLAKVRDLPLKDAQKDTKRVQNGPHLPTSTNNTIEGEQTTTTAYETNTLTSNSSLKTVPVFQPTFAGLIQARKICRFEMSKIVREVDLVANDPTLSTDPERDSYFLHPLVFKQLLPIVRSLSPENATLGVRDPAAQLLLGCSQPKSDDRALPPIHMLGVDLKEHALLLRRSIEKVNYRAYNYRMQGCVGPVSEDKVHSQAQLFNDLDNLDQRYRLSEIAVWIKDGRLMGIVVRYTNGEKRQRGACDGSPAQSLALLSDGSEVIVEVVVKELIDDGEVPGIVALSLATSIGNVLDTETATAKDEEPAPSSGKTTENPSASKAADSSNQPASTAGKSDNISPAEKSVQTKVPEAESKPAKTSRIKTTTWLKPEDPRYSLRGFFGFTHQGLICTLGVIWGKDSFVPIPTAGIKPTLCRSFLSLSKDLQNNVRGHPTFAGKFLMGTPVSTGFAGPTSHFNALDAIDTHWEIKTIGFASNGSKLCGLKVIYHNGRELLHGDFTEQTKKWTCDIGSSLFVVKMTAGRIDDTDPVYIDTLEFIRGNAEGVIPAWPLEVPTLRFLGEGEARVSNDVTEVVETAPKTGSTQWSIRGFYGEMGGGIMTRLGAIWGQG